MFDMCLQWVRQRLGVKPSWRGDTIKDEWFRAHFCNAAGAVHEWLSQHIKIEHSHLLDFGCGDGITDLAMVLRYAPQGVLGVDITRTWPRLLQIARREIQLSHLPVNLQFRQIRPGEMLAAFGQFDATFSWSTFEHVNRSLLLPILGDLHATLKPGGLLFIQIEPLFYSPFGSHLRRFGIQPWAHLLLSEAELEQQVLSFSGEIPTEEIEYNFQVRSFGDYKRFIFGEYKKLNRLTADELIDVVSTAGFEILRETRGRSNLDAPEILRQQYSLDNLLINEVALLAKRLA